MTRLPTPTVALIGAAASRLINANRVTPAGVSNVARPSDQRFVRYPPTRHSSVLPSAMSAAVESEPAVVALASRAATKTAGHIRYPHSSAEASASPVGGQMGVALGFIDASSRPSFAAAK